MDKLGALALYGRAASNPKEVTYHRISFWGTAQHFYSSNTAQIDCSTIGHIRHGLLSTRLIQMFGMSPLKLYCKYTCCENSNNCVFSVLCLLAATQLRLLLHFFFSLSGVCVCYFPRQIKLYFKNWNKNWKWSWFQRHGDHSVNTINSHLLISLYQHCVAQLCC